MTRARMGGTGLATDAGDMSCCESDLKAEGAASTCHDVGGVPGVGRCEAEPNQLVAERVIQAQRSFCNGKACALAVGVGAEPRSREQCKRVRGLKRERRMKRTNSASL